MRIRVARGLASAVRQRGEGFAYQPARHEPLAALRIGVASVLLGQAALVAPAYRALYGGTGLLRGPARDLLATPYLPHLDDLTRLLAPAGACTSSVLAAVAACYVIALTLLLLGLGTRAAAGLSWFVHLALLTTGRGTNYGADRLANVFLFYLVWSPAGGALSLDRRLTRRLRPPTSPAARLSLRVVQLHLCVVYAASGIYKALSRSWWDGDAIWRSVMSPDYRRFGFDFSWLASHPWVAVLAGWAVLVVEVGYAVLIWRRATRRAWILATVALHLGIAVFMGLTVFGALMIVLTVAAFGVDPEPRADAV
jgi:Vitamin K-dependent gamma-carboxylase